MAATEIEDIQSKTIDWLRFPLMVLVVMIHVPLCGNLDLTLPIEKSSLVVVLYKLFARGICFAAVPTFFLMSGYLFYTDKIKNTPPSLEFYKKKLSKRFHSIFLPFVFAILLYALLSYLLLLLLAIRTGEDAPSVVNFLNEHGWIRMFWDNNRLEELENPVPVNILGMKMHHCFPYLSPMWYLRDLIVVLLISPLVYFFVTKTKYVGLALVGMLYIFNIWIPLEGFSANAFFFFSLGAFLRIQGKNILVEFQKVKVQAVIIAVTALVLMLLFEGKNTIWSKVFVRLYIVAGVISIFNLAGYIISRRKSAVNFFLSKGSFFIYLVHCIFVIQFSDRLINIVIPNNTQIFILIKYLLTVALTIGICLIIFYIMKKKAANILAFFMGGR